MRAFLVYAALLTTAACGSLLDPDSRFSFSATQAAMGGRAEFAEAAAAGTGTVRFSGTMATPSPCFRLSAGAAVSGQEIAITVTATSTLGRNELCATVVATSDYTGAVRELTPGTYRVTVFHRLSNRPGEARTIAGISLVVP